MSSQPDKNKLPIIPATPVKPVPLKGIEYKLPVIQPSIFQSGSKFDEGLTGGMDQTAQRAYRQGFWDELGNTGARLAKIPFGVFETLGYVADVEGYLTDLKLMDSNYDNWLSSLMRSAKEGIDEAAPLYRYDQNKVIDLNDRAWWFENGSNLFNSIAEFGITGYGLGAAQSAIAAKSLANIVKTGSQAKAVQAGLQGLTALELTHAEGVMEATNVYKAVYDSKIKEGLPEYLARQEASDAASTTSRTNKINIALNLTSLSPVFNNIPQRIKLAAALKGTGKEVIEDLENKLAKGVISPANTTIKAIYESTQEAGEEAINVIAGNLGLAQGGLMEGSVTDIIAQSLSSEEGQLSMILGAIGGAGNTVLMNSLANSTLGGRKSSSDVKSQVFEEQTKYMLEKSKQLQNSKEKIENALAKTDKVALDQATSELKSSLVFDSVVNSKQRQDAYKALTTGTTEVMKTFLDEIASLPDTEAIAKGLNVDPSSTDYYKNVANELKNDITTLSKKYDDIHENFAYPFNDKLQGYSNYLFFIDTNKYFNDKLIGKYTAKANQSQLDFDQLTDYATLYPLYIDQTAYSNRIKSLKKDLDSLNKELTKDNALKYINQEKGRKLLEDKIAKYEEAVTNNKETIKDALKAFAETSNKNINDVVKEFNESLTGIEVPVKDKLSLLTLEDSKEALNKHYKFMTSDEGRKYYESLTDESTKQQEVEVKKLTAQKQQDESKVQVNKPVEQKVENTTETLEDIEKQRAEELIIETKAAYNGERGNESWIEAEERVNKKYDEKIKNLKSNDNITNTTTANTANEDEVYSGEGDYGKDPNIEENFEEHDKVVETANAIAYGYTSPYENTDSGKVTVSNEYGETSIDILSDKVLMPGDNITLHLLSKDEDTFYTGEDLGERTVEIKINDQLAGHLHTISWINDNTANNKDYDNIELQKKNNLNIRKQLLNRDITTQVLSKSHGKALYKPSELAINRLDTKYDIVISDGGQFKIGSTSFIGEISNKPKHIKGASYVMLPTPNGKFYAHRLQTIKLSDDISNVLVTAIQAYTNPSAHAEFINDVKTLYNIDLKGKGKNLNPDKLNQFINLFTYTLPSTDVISSDGTSLLKEIQTGVNTGKPKYYLTNGDKGQFFVVRSATSKDSGIVMNVKDAPENILKDTFKNMYFKHDIKRIDQTIQLPKMEERLKLDKTLSYKEYILNTSLSWIDKVVSPSGTESYFSNPVVIFGDPKPVVIGTTEDPKEEQEEDLSELDSDPITKDESTLYSKTKIKERVNFVFESNTELSTIGTQEQYSQYLDTIYPDSKVKDIIYHGTNEIFDEFDKSKLKEDNETALSKIGFSFVNSKRIASKYGNVNFAIINTTNPKEISINDIEIPLETRSHYESYYASKLKNIVEDGAILEFPDGQQEYIVFESEQIHILGSKQDIEGFKKYIKSIILYSKVEDFSEFSPNTNLTPLQFNIIVDKLANDIAYSDNVEDTIDRFKEIAENNKSKSIYANMLADFEKIKIEALLKLDRIGFLDLNKSYDETSEDIIIKDRNYEQEEDNTDWRNSLTKELKRTFSFIPDADNTGATKKVFGLPVYKDADEVLTKVMSLVGGKSFDYSEIIDNLKAYSDNYPYLNKLIDRLSNEEDFVKNAFVSHVNKYLSNYKVITTEEKLVSNKPIRITKMFDSNSNAAKTIIKEKWFNNAIEKLFNDDETINKELKEKLLDDYKELIKSKDPVAARSWLENIGIELSDKAWSAFVNSKRISRNTLTFNSHFTSNSGVFNIIAKDLAKINSIDDYDITDKTLILYERIYGDPIELISFRNGSGNTVMAYTRPRYMNQIENKLKTKEFQDQLLATHFSKASLLLSKLRDEPNKGSDIIKNNFSIWRVDQFRDIARNNPEDLTKIEQDKLRLVTFFSTDKSKERYVNVILPPASDKKPLYGWTIPGFNEGFSITDQVEITGELESNLLNSIYGEYLRILEASKGSSIDAMNKGGKQFILFDGLNNSELFDVSGNILQKTTAEFKAIAKQYIVNAIETLTKNTINNWTANDLVKYIPTNSNTLEQNALDYAVHNILSNINYYQTLLFDPALYFKDNLNETFINIGKRSALLLAPRDIPSLNQTINYVVAKDAVLPSKFIEKYDKIKTTDAQELWTVDSYLDFIHNLGQISTDDYNRLKKQTVTNPNNDLDFTDIDLILQPKKPVYTGVRSLGWTMDVNYIKSAAYPLIPNFTKGFEIDKLRQAMYKNKIDRIAFESAVKTGLPDSLTTLFDKEGNLILENGEVNLDKGRLSLSSEYSGSQLETPVKDWFINRGTQADKLLFGDTSDIEGMNELYKQYTDLFNKLFDIKKNELINELYTDGIIDIVKLKKRIVEEAVERNWSKEDLQYLDLEISIKKFKMPLWSFHSHSKIESLLNSIVDKKVRQIITPGFNAIQASNTGYKAITEGVVFTDSFDTELKPQTKDNPAQILIKWNFKDNKGNLLDINKFITNGKIDFNKLPQELLKTFAFRIPNQKHSSSSYAEIVGFLPPEAGDLVIVPSEYVVQMGSDFDLDKLYGYLFSYRLVDNKLVKATEELMTQNETYDNLLAELYRNELALTLQGDIVDSLNRKDPRFKSSFDKYVNLQASKEVLEEKLAKLVKPVSEEEAIKNKLLDIRLAVFSNPAMYDKITQSVEADELTELAKEIGETKSFDHTLINPDYYTYKYLSAIAGKSAVGVFATASTMNSMLQVANVYDKKVNFIGYEGIERLRYDTDKPRYGNNLSDAKDLSGNFKSESISELLTAAVDNEKLQLMYRLNINEFTYGVINALIQSGFPLRDTMYLINTPIVKQFVDQIANSTNPKQFKKDFLNTLKVNEDKNYTISLPDIERIYKDNTTPDIDKLNYAIMKLFLNADDKGLTLRRVASILSADSKNIGSLRADSVAKQKQIEKFLAKPPLTNIDIILNNSIPGYATDTARLANEAFDKLFPIGSEVVSELYNDVIKITGEKQLAEEQATLLSNVFDHFKSYLYTKPGSPVNTDLNNIDFVNATKVMKEKYPDNYFLKQLAIKRSKKGKNIVIMNSSSLPMDEGRIIRDVSNLIANPSTNEFMQLAAQYSYLTGGIQQANQFLRYLPAKFLTKLGYGDFLNTISFNDYTTILKTPDDTYENIAPFVIQYIQHNPYLATEVNKDQVKITKNTLTLNKDNSILVEYNNKQKFPLFVRSEEELYLFKDANESKGNYIKIPILGSNGLREYNYSKSIADSVYTKTKATPVKSKTDDAKTIPNNPLFMESYGLINNKNITVEAYNEIAANPADPSFKVLAQVFIDNFDKIQPVKFQSKNLGKDIEGSYFKNIITLNPSILVHEHAKQRVFLHESLHALLSKTIDNPGTAIQLVNNLNILRDRMKEKLSNEDKSRYSIPLSSNQEFVTYLMTNKGFQNKANEIPFNTKTVFDRFVEILNQFISALGVRDNTILAEGLNTILGLVYNESVNTESSTNTLNSIVDNYQLFEEIPGTVINDNIKIVNIRTSDRTYAQRVANSYKNTFIVTDPKKVSNKGETLYTFTVRFIDYNRQEVLNRIKQCK